MSLNIIRICKFTYQLTAQGGFACPNIADNHIQATAQADSKLQFLKISDMLPGMKKKIRVRRVRERFSVKIKNFKVIHGQGLRFWVLGSRVQGSGLPFFR